MPPSRLPFLQNPDSKVSTVRGSLREIYRNRGISGLWHGTSAGVMKTVPKYCVAVAVKVRARRHDWRGYFLPRTRTTASYQPWIKFFYHTVVLMFIFLFAASLRLVHTSAVKHSIGLFLACLSRSRC